MTSQKDFLIALEDCGIELEPSGSVKFSTDANCALLALYAKGKIEGAKQNESRNKIARKPK